MRFIVKDGSRRMTLTGCTLKPCFIWRKAPQISSRSITTIIERLSMENLFPGTHAPDRFGRNRGVRYCRSALAISEKKAEKGQSGEAVHRPGRVAAPTKVK
jgi:hypothetical protein